MPLSKELTIVAEALRDTTKHRIEIGPIKNNLIEARDRERILIISLIEEKLLSQGMRFHRKEFMDIVGIQL